MSAEGSPDKLSTLVAEQILSTLYGDDLAGCPVTLDEIATLVYGAIQQRTAQDQKLLETYEAVIASLHQLSTPPDPTKITGPDQLRGLLSERLDAIRSITGKTIETVGKIRAERARES